MKSDYVRVCLFVLIAFVQLLTACVWLHKHFLISLCSQVFISLFVIVRRVRMCGSGRLQTLDGISYSLRKREGERSKGGH